MSILTPSVAELEALIAEDAPWGDLTTEALGLAALPARMRFTARHEMVVAGIAIAVGLVGVAGGRAEGLVADGDRVAAGTVLMEAEGPAGALHRAWKQGQTTLEILSGIATAARALVEAAAAGGRVVPVACTRKTLAGARRFQIGAIRAGGCVPHRLGLSETVLVFAEHRAFLGATPLSETVARLRRVGPEKKLVIEVGAVDEAVAAAQAGFDVIQLEKFAPAGVAEAVAGVRAVSAALVASAGGVDATNAAAHVAAGADLLVSSAPYQGRPRDVQVRLGPV